MSVLDSQKDIAERSVIGSVLIDTKTLAIAREIISPNDFYSKCNQSIFETFCSLEDSGKQISSASVYGALANDPSFDSAGGINYLTECTNALPSASQIEHYAGIVRSDSLKRKLNLFGKQIEVISNQPVRDIDSEISRLCDELFNMISSSPITPWMNFNAAMESACMDLVSESNELVLKSGFIDLDAKLSGFRPGTLTIIAARPAMGKTALGLNIMQHVAFKEKQPVAFFSLEMTTMELINRTLSCMSDVNGNAIRQKKLSDDEWRRVLGAVEKYKRSNIYIDETAALDIAILKERAMRMQRQYGIKMIIVDYLQLMRSKSKNVQNREQEVADISRGLKEISKTLHIPVIALAQLNRAVDARACKQPVLSDLRESGSIEQDADSVIFIHREDYYNPNAKPTNEAEIIIAKQRSGPTGIVKLRWEGQHTRFENLETVVEDAYF